jgi:hypothetical protein
LPPLSFAERGGKVRSDFDGKIGADPHSRGRTRDATGEPTPEEEAVAVGGPRRQIYVGARGMPYKTSGKV